MKWIVLVVAFSAVFVGMNPRAHAGVLLEVGGVYMGDTISTSSTTSSTKYLYNVGVLFSLSKTVWGGWSYLGVSHTDSATGTSTTYSSMDTGPTLKYQFGKNQIYSLSGTVNIVSRATYSTTGSSSENWEGMSYVVSLGVMPEVTEGLHVGASLNYFMANYTKKTVSNTESSASNSKSWIYPAISLMKAW